MRSRLRSIACAASVLALTGCASAVPPIGLPLPEGERQTCVSWVSFADARAAYEDAALVVVGVADPSARQVELLSGVGELHRVAVESVLKGELEGDELYAAAPRDYCVAEPPQPAEDPIPTGERMVLLLNPAGDVEGRRLAEERLLGIRIWSTLTPEWGALPLPAGEEPPFDTAAAGTEG